MENVVVLVDSNDYDGRWVALKSFEDRTVVGVGDDPGAALEEARSKGVQDPLLVFIDEPGTVHIF